MEVFEIHTSRSQYLSDLNTWAYKSVLENIIHINDFERHPTNLHPEFVARLKTLLPGLKNHCCSCPEKGGFIYRLDDGTWMGHVLEHVVIELQKLAGVPCSFGQTRQSSLGDGIYYMVFESPHPKIAYQALKLGIDLVTKLFHQQDFELDAALETLSDISQEFLLGPSTFLIAKQAKLHKIPMIRPSDYNWLQLGFGKYSTDFTPGITTDISSISVDLSKDKALTKELLERFGIPVPQGKRVNTQEEILKCFKDWQELVIKPADKNRAKGVTLDIKTPNQAIGAFEEAQKYSKNILVEKFYSGTDYRLLVMNHEVVAVLAGLNLTIEGDGSSTVEDLIIKKNHDEQLLDGDRTTIKELEFDMALQVLLENQGVNLKTILKAKQSIHVRKHCNISMSIEVDAIHTSILKQASLATKILHLKIAGIDLIAKDIRQPLLPDNGCFIEVNAGPSLCLHEQPITGKPQMVSELLIKDLAQKHQFSKFKMACVAGKNSDISFLPELSKVFQSLSYQVGSATTQGAYLNSKKIDYQFHQLQDSYNAILMNKEIDFAILETTTNSLKDYGMPLAKGYYDWIIILEPDKQHELNFQTIGETNAYFKTLRTAIDASHAQSHFILNADEPILCDLCEYSEGKNIFLTQKSDFNHFAKFIRENDIVVQRQNDKILIHYPHVEYLDYQAQLNNPYMDMALLFLKKHTKAEHHL